MKNPTLIFTATYNEKENIVNLINDILNLSKNYDILIVDDNSIDKTGLLIKKIIYKNKRVNLIQRPFKLGLGSAHKIAFQYAVKHGYKTLVTMDADYSHDPKEIPQLVSKLSKYDFVIGSRYMKGGSCNYSGYRLFISKLANLSANFFLKIPLDETTTSFRAFNTKSLKKLNISSIRSQGYSFFLESLYHLHRANLKMTQIPINFIDRKYGKSKIPKFELFNGMFNLGKLIIDKWFLKNHITNNYDLKGKCFNCSSEFLFELYKRNNQDRKAKNTVEAYQCSTMSHTSKPQVLSCLECGLNFSPTGINDPKNIKRYESVIDETYISNIEGRKLTFSKLLKNIEPYIHKNTEILEVGSYCGIFGHIVKKSGYDYVGIEPSRWASNYASEKLKLNVINGTLEKNLKNLKKSYDTIVMWDVLEHLQDPFSTLKILNKLLSKDGTFCFTTIDIDTWFPKLTKSKWPWIMEMHLYYFSSASLSSILEKYGFQIVENKPYIHRVPLKYLFDKLIAIFPNPILNVIFKFIKKITPFNPILPVGFGDVRIYICKKIDLK